VFPTPTFPGWTIAAARSSLMDATDAKCAALFGFSEGGNLAMTFAAAQPSRVSALVTFGVFAKRIWSPDYPWAPTPEARAMEYEYIEREWGRMMDLSRIMPTMVNDVEYGKRVATYLRRSASPGAAVSLLKMNTHIDVRHLLPIIKAPTLIMHRIGDRDANIEEARFIAARIPGARLIELPGEDHLPWIGDSDTVADETPSSSRVRDCQVMSTACSRPSCSDIVGRRKAPLGWAIARGMMTRRHHTIARRSRGAAARSTPRETDSSQSSTARRARFAVDLRCTSASRVSGFRFAQGCTPVRSPCRTTM
jgi:hypothetical protein